MVCSVSLADPGLEDCPLIGCSEGFELLTGYTKAEVVGCNCRFMNQGQRIEPDVREQLREAVSCGRDFVGVLPNRRKNGEIFQNLLHLTTLNVRGRKYIIGVQADVTHVNVDLSVPVRIEDMGSMVSQIFSGSIDAWVQMQAREFWMRQPEKSIGMQSNNWEQCEAAKSNAKSDAMSAFTPSNLDTEESNGSSGDQWSRQNSGSSGQDGVPLKSAGDQWSRQSSGSSGQDLGPLKSAGSVGHPDNCNNECVFHFWRGGCKADRDCRFCHEFHPRQNPNKNRRALRRFAGIPGVPELKPR
jgi:PAS domain S-box-containing protein